MTAKSTPKRLDALLVERGLADSIAKAQAMILAGEVLVDAVRADKAGTRFPPHAHIEVSSRTAKFVSRGGLKLEGALADFAVDPNGRVCMDVGASTGGFTDCLLQYGAVRVYAMDVNVNQLAWKLRQDRRVIPVERNARELRSKDIPEPVDLIVVDVSFISVSKILPAALAAAKAGADLLILVKPQFELPRQDVGPGGIVSSPALHDKAVAVVRKAAAQLGLEVLATRPSRLPGAEGNQEYFLHARKKSME
jgi:23S rRNA (cytidine1920-2'-O)/16S rRNA (cytidine1409-2'-O)-methyltransferase